MKVPFNVIPTLSDTFKNTALKICFGLAFICSLMSIAPASAQNAVATTPQNPCCDPLKISAPQIICREVPPLTSTVAVTVSGIPTGCTPYYTWMVNGATFTGQGAATIQINIGSIAATATSIIVKVGAFCNGKCYDATITIAVGPILNASFNETISTSGSVVTMTATAVATPGNHYWLLYEANCGNPCTPTTFVKSQPGGTTFTHSPLQTGKCYILYHYVYTNNCWTIKSRCSMITSLRAPVTPSAESSTPLPAQFQKDLKFLEQSKN